MRASSHSQGRPRCCSPSNLQDHHQMTLVPQEVGPLPVAAREQLFWGSVD
jgi:hypothetical protein